MNNSRLVILLGCLAAAVVTCKKAPAPTKSAPIQVKGPDAAQIEAWLSGRFNGYVNEALSLSADARGRQAEALMTGIEKNSNGQQQFLNSLHAMVLVPEDLRYAGAAKRYLSVAGTGMPGGLPEAWTAALERLIDPKSREGAAGLLMKRLQRAWLIMNNQWDAARPLARELAASGEIGDRTTVAFVDRAKGERTTYKSLLDSCPPADAAYIQKFGKPAARKAYCEDLVATMSRAVYEQLGPSSPGGVTELLVETNRLTAPSDPSRATSTSVLVDGAAVIRREIEAAEKMSRVEREAAVNRLREESPDDLFVHDFEKSARMFALDPGLEMGAASLFYSTQYLPATLSVDRGDPRDDLRRAIVSIVEEKFQETKSREWKRGLRNYLVFAGQYERALQLSRELRSLKDGDYAPRDVGLTGLLELVNGDVNAYRREIINCPGQPKDGTLENPKFFCMMVAWYNAQRIIEIADDKPSPPQLTQIMIDMAERVDDVHVALGSAATLIKPNPATADRIYEKMLANREFMREHKQEILWGRVEVAKEQKQWPEALKRIDVYIGEMFGDEDPIPATDLWKALAQLPESSDNAMQRSRVTPILLERVSITIQGRNWPQARNSIDRLLADSIGRGDGRTVRHQLLTLADKQLAQGMREEPLRILGYLATQPLDWAFSDRLNLLRRQAGARELKKFDSPWDSAPPDARPARREPAKTTV